MIKTLIFPIVGGLGLFIYGIRLMGDGLQKAAGDRLRRVLKALTTNPVMGMTVGAGITSLIQSSSATTVMIVGFVNAGLMTLIQAIGVILGANIGTTITAQIIAFKLTDYALPVIGIGLALNFFCKKRFWKFIGEFLLGFGMLFLGLGIMAGAVKPLGQSVVVRQAFINFSYNPALGILTGMVATMVVQSSSVTVGLVLTLATVGLLDINGALFLILGTNIGTCITAMLASIGTTVSAKRAAVAHVMFNLLGTCVAMALFPFYKSAVLLLSKDIARQCANFHTMFNAVNTLLFLPLTGLFAKVITKIVPGKEVVVEYGPKYLEKHLLNTPLVALDASTKEIIRMARLAKEMVGDAIRGFFREDQRALFGVGRKEVALDGLQEAVTNYLIELTQRPLSAGESEKIPSMLHSVNDIERIGDHSENLVELSQRKINERLPFSNIAIGELKTMFAEVDAMADDVINALQTNNPEDARPVLDREERVNRLTVEMRQNHIQRLSEGTCKVLSGIVFLDIISNFEKIGDHLTNVAQAVMDRLQWRPR